MQTKGDILVRAKDQGNSSFANAHLADPNRLWPKGIVEFKFWKTFPSGNLSFRAAFSERDISHRSESLDEECDGLPHQHVPLRHLCPCRTREPQLRHHLPRHRVQKRAGYERREPGNVLELRLLRQRFDRARARALAYAWVRARAQSDTGVGRVLVCSQAFL